MLLVTWPPIEAEALMVTVAHRRSVHPPPPILVVRPGQMIHPVPPVLVTCLCYCSVCMARPIVAIRHVPMVSPCRRRLRLMFPLLPHILLPACSFPLPHLSTGHALAASS